MVRRWKTPARRPKKPSRVGEALVLSAKGGSKIKFSLSLASSLSETTLDTAWRTWRPVQGVCRLHGHPLWVINRN